MVHVTNGADVAVRLVPLEFRLGHQGVPCAAPNCDAIAAPA
jgi:hypothetical protein